MRFETIDVPLMACYGCCVGCRFRRHSPSIIDHCHDVLYASRFFPLSLSLSLSLSFCLDSIPFFVCVCLCGTLCPAVVGVASLRNAATRTEKDLISIEMSF